MTSRHRAELLEAIRPRVRAYAESYPVLATAASDLDLVAPDALQAFRRMQDARAGLPGAQAYDAPTVSGGAASSSTERAAVGTTCVRCDEPGACRCAATPPMDLTSLDRRTLDHTLNRLDLITRPGQLVTDPAEWCRNVTNLCLTLRRLIEAWTPHHASDRDRRQVAKINRPEAADTWCEHHKQADLHEPAEHYGTVSGNLDHPMHLCGYCYWQVRRNGKLPNANAMEKRHRTGKNEKERV